MAAKCVSWMTGQTSAPRVRTGHPARRFPPLESASMSGSNHDGTRSVPGTHCGCTGTRRQFLWDMGAGFTGLALTAMLEQDGFFAKHAYGAEGTANPATLANPLAPRPAHFAAKAKHVIFLFMYGGPSSMDTWDYK